MSNKEGGQKPRNIKSFLSRQLRSEVLLASVLWEEPTAINQAKSMLAAFIHNKTMVSPNLREVIYTGSVQSGDITLWSHCWDRFYELTTNNGPYVERMELLRALAATKNLWLQNRLLAQVIYLQKEELVEILDSIAGTPSGAMACRFLQAKWNELQMKLGSGSVAFAQVITAITQYGATKFDYDEVSVNVT